MTVLRKRIFRAWPFLPFASGILIFLYVGLQNAMFGILAPEFANCRISCLTWPSGVAPFLLTTEQMDYSTPHDIVGNMLNAVAVALAIALPLRAMRRNKSRAVSGPIYLGTLVITALVAGVVRVTVFPLAVTEFPVPAWLSISVRYLGILLIIHLLFGINNQRYQEASERSEAAAAEARRALDRLRQQQAMVVEADERARREVADFLHDRVQAGLLVAAMQVRNVSRETDEKTAAALEDAINDLELLRAEAVRGASRRLSPDLNAVGLDSALTDLARSWNAAMAVKVTFEPRAYEILHKNAENTITTACYRTVEQGLLNAAAHGKAKNVTVSFTTIDESLVLMVTDDGAGVPTDYVPGAGTALIDAWMSAVHGSWQLYRANNGSTLEVRIPIA